jgi:hypothetical protein
MIKKGEWDNFMPQIQNSIESIENSLGNVVSSPNVRPSKLELITKDRNR